MGCLPGVALLAEFDRGLLGDFGACGFDMEPLGGRERFDHDAFSVRHVAGDAVIVSKSEVRLNDRERGFDGFDFQRQVTACLVELRV